MRHVVDGLPENAEDHLGSNRRSCDATDNEVMKFIEWVGCKVSIEHRLLLPTSTYQAQCHTILVLKFLALRVLLGSSVWTALHRHQKTDIPGAVCDYLTSSSTP